MAKENVKLFQEKLLKSEELQKKLKELEAGYSGDKSDREKVAESILIPLAEEEGLPFTVEELKEAEAEGKQEGALSDGELKDISGGATLGICFAFGAGVGYTCKDGLGGGICLIVGKDLYD